MNPNTVTAEGTCPSCGRAIEPGGTSHGDAPDGDVETLVDEDDYRPPWHFWMMVALVAAYLGWWLVRLLIWTAEQLF